MSSPQREKGGRLAGHGDPTPEEIRALCAEIQATWSTREEQERSGQRPNLHIQPTALRSVRPSRKGWRPSITLHRLHEPR